MEYFASFQQIVSYLYDPDRFFEENLRRAGVRHFLHGSPKLDDSAHAAQQLAQPLERLALYLEEKAPVLFPSEADRQFRRRVPRSGHSPGGRARLSRSTPAAAASARTGPSAQWAALGETLFGMPRRRGCCWWAARPTGRSSRTCSEAWRGRPMRAAVDLPLPELAAILARARLFLGHDSGISHIAAAAGAPSLLLFGPTDPDIWAPLGRPVTHPPRAGRDNLSGSLETVREAAGGMPPARRLPAGD